MSKNKHTSGPWVLEPASDGGRVLAQDDRQTIIHVPPCSPFNEQARADARLISAAPALLEALEEMYEVYKDMQGGDGETPPEIHRARAAIAKARGEQ